ncbi:pentatricopeptide repeat-containing protein At2g15980 isoform X2 [Oryza brachyantha]|uniref:pentatricopeptide repeat-containing protein At2g15980 isoform X2 n=1 Tax=Oryza brachyantha TaxID=4533 RepID=UPI00077651A1|nr:pentatricopeptide repeat-containing protein At2g15980 isoform X2 [Oryza brachyantha]
MHTPVRDVKALGGDPTADNSSLYFIDADHPYATTTASILTSHRSRSKWSHLSSLPVPNPLPVSAIAAIPLLLRHRPNVALRFHLFAMRHLLPSGSPPPLLLSVSVTHVAANSRLRHAALSVLASTAHHYPHSQIFTALAATYRRFSSAPFVFDLLLLAYLRSRQDTIAATSITRYILAAGARPLPSTSTILLRSLPSAAAALDMYHEIYTRPCSRINSQLLPTVHTFNSLLLAFYREGKCNDFKIVLQEMGRYSCRHNVCTYNIRMAAYCDCKDMEKARGLWDEMVQEGIQPDVATYNTMISGYCGSGEVGMAEEMFKDMEMSVTDPSDMRRRGFQMVAEVVEEVVNVLCQKKRVNEALGFLKEEMRREEFVPSQGCYEVLIREFCDQGEVELAMRLQAEMAGKGFKARREIYHAFVCAYEKTEDYGMAERLRKELLVISDEGE